MGNLCAQCLRHFAIANVIGGGFVLKICDGVGRGCVFQNSLQLIVLRLVVPISNVISGGFVSARARSEYRATAA